MGGGGEDKEKKWKTGGGRREKEGDSIYINIIERKEGRIKRKGMDVFVVNIING